MAVFFFSASVLANPDGAVSPSQQYLFYPGTVTRIKAATSKMKTQYPQANSVIGITRAVNNSHETVDYIVAETLTALNT